MAFKLEDNEELSVFEVMAMVRGTATQDKHHFFNKVGKSEGEQGENDFIGLIAGNIPKVLKGARIPINKVANNPSLASPSVTAMKYFGALPGFKVAIDQLHAKKVGVFPSATFGAGQNSFDFQNNPLFSGESSLMSIAGKILLGSSASSVTSEAHQLFEPLKTLANTIGKSGGADFQTMINPASDMSKMMPMLATGFGGGTNPFSSSALSDGITMAKEVTDYIKKISG
jgi:hypothetical protein